MKRGMFFVAIALIFGMATWGVSGCGGAGQSVTADENFAANDFTGDFKLKDESCSYNNLVKEFRINKQNTFLTIVNPGGSGASQGDVFILNESKIAGDYPIIDSPDLGCAGGYILDQAQADESKDTFQIDAGVGDLLVFCSDSNSADGQCAVSYTRTSTD